MMKLIVGCWKNYSVFSSVVERRAMRRISVSEEHVMNLTFPVMALRHRVCRSRKVVSLREEEALQA